jgi:hypothetical protein
MPKIWVKTELTVPVERDMENRVRAVLRANPSFIIQCVAFRYPSFVAPEDDAADSKRTSQWPAGTTHLMEVHVEVKYPPVRHWELPSDEVAVKFFAARVKDAEEQVRTALKGDPSLRIDSLQAVC